MIKPIKIVAVSYLNTLPFTYAISEYFKEYPYELSLDIPSRCADQLLNGFADIALVPVAAIPQLSHCGITSSYCIAANGPVASVLLLSDVPLSEIKKVFLDYQSMTSVKLVKILAQNFWKIDPEWIHAKEGYEKQIKGKDAAVVIGDRALEMASNFTYAYDLANEWKKHTGIPFVFACWMANKSVAPFVLHAFENALKRGIHQIDKMLSGYQGKFDINFAKEYLTQKINYQFDEEKKKSLAIFLADISQKEKEKIFI